MKTKNYFSCFYLFHSVLRAFIIVTALSFLPLEQLDAKSARNADKLDGHDWKEVEALQSRITEVEKKAGAVDTKVNQANKKLIEVDARVTQVDKKLGQRVDQLQSKVLTVGDYKISAHTKDHNGWLLCNGRELLSRDYQELFNVVKCSFSQGIRCDAKASTTFFKLPDPRARVTGIVGQGAGLSKRTLGQQVGKERHKLTVAEMPSHNHGVNENEHKHNLGISGGDDWFGGNADTGERRGYWAQTTGVKTGISIQHTGGNQPHGIMQPTLFIGNLFIYSGK